MASSRSSRARQQARTRRHERGARDAMDADGVARRVTFFGGRRSRVETHNSSAWRAAGMWTLTSCAVLKILSETTSSTVAQGRGARVVRDAGPRSAAPDHEDEGLNSVKRRPHPEEARKRRLEGWIGTLVKAATLLAICHARATLPLARLRRASGAIYPRGLIDPLGNCPWPGPWIRAYGAHLLS